MSSIGAGSAATTSLTLFRARIARLLGQKDGEPYDAERGQAIVRIVVVPLFFLYIIPALILTHRTGVLVTAFGFYSAFYFPFVWLLLYDTVKRPGNYLWRRGAAMTGDYIAMTFAMSVGGATTLPVYATLLWVTVGNGLRFGTTYLAAATGAAVAAIGVATLLNEYWQANPYMVLTLAVTAILVPGYIFVLIQRLQKATTLAHEANLAKSRFLAQASHDLRQPIHAISLFTACLRDAGLGREERQMVENIDRSLQSLSHLFRSLLDISTLDSGKVIPKMEAVSIGALIEDVVRQNSQAAQWAKVTLRAVPSRCHVHVDNVLLTTMIQNIVTNALKYAPGQPVLIGCRRRGGKLAIEIYDRGGGIAAEYLPLVFDEFYQVRERGDKDVDGVGLGLPIVRRLGHLMGLSISIRSVKDQGTAVIIDGLQIVPLPAAKAKSGIPRLPPVLEGLRIVLVEDDEDVLLATAMLLEKWGCRVQAETAAPTERVECDILITDFDLGQGQTGTDCIAAVRELAGRDVSAIVMTGHDEARVRADLGDAAIPILSKPVRPAELRSVLTAQVLRQRNTVAG
ncbi:hybrid sensor histidine kinase/response regulator [Pararhizobium polonicum]|uniref:hybrid sensor histidine kinase/response regulator n=1 Tax=Pararhizobium polonicum TaxID=1612624 RepID=UPI000A6B743D|nr:hybrid sensor histidine kinase/response regulator [Pararhizobium polonicum]